MTNPATAGTRIAIEFLMLWIEPDRLAAATHIEQVMREADEQTRTTIIAGLLNLSMLLAFELAKASDAEPEGYVEWIRAYLQGLSSNLPE